MARGDVQVVLNRTRIGPLLFVIHVHEQHHVLAGEVIAELAPGVANVQLGIEADRHRDLRAILVEGDGHRLRLEIGREDARE